MPGAAVACALGVAIASGPAGAQQQPTVRWETLAIEGVEAFNRGDNATALDRFQQALQFAAGFAADDQRRINSIINLATAHRALHEYEAAQFYLLEAIRLQEAAGDPDLVMTLDALALTFEAQGLAGQAEPLLHRAVALLEELAGVDHPFTGLVLEHLAATVVALGRYDEAAAILGRIIDIRAANFGPSHRSLAPPLTRQGLAYIAVSRNLDAAEALRRALAIWRVGPPPPAAELLLTLEALVDLSQLLGRLKEAADYERQVLLVLRVEHGGRGAALADELDEYARLLRRAGDPAEAEQAELEARHALAPVLSQLP